jgi:hypothetical protein
LRDIVAVTAIAKVEAATIIATDFEEWVHLQWASEPSVSIHRLL